MTHGSGARVALEALETHVARTTRIVMNMFCVCPTMWMRAAARMRAQVAGHVWRVQNCSGATAMMAPVNVRMISRTVAKSSERDNGSNFADPFPLPFSKEMDPAMRREYEAEDGIDLASEQQGVEGMYVPIRVPNRDNEDRPRLLARLQYQCRKRGTLETDLLLSTFAHEELRRLPDDELHELDRLLDEPDWDIFYWCTDRKPVPERWHASFTTPGRLGYRLRIHTRNDQRSVRRFPSLKGDIQSPLS